MKIPAISFERGFEDPPSCARVVYGMGLTPPYIGAANAAIQTSPLRYYLVGCILFISAKSFKGTHSSTAIKITPGGYPQVYPQAGAVWQTLLPT